MLQIIGWLGCLYLFIKGIELLGLAARWKEDPLRGAVKEIVYEDGGQTEIEVESIPGLANMQWAGGLSIVGALGFAAWLLNQGEAFNSTTSYSSSIDDAFYECMREANTQAEILAC
ncbi:hypothetical protein [Sphingomicrobium arenosum]|uniref:hypothetical protein n=1 Tax=Sphingomicrobium arenosum TaxID=2233861 RepID=UPI0022404741|nr:hypothetical protein [Sphingomicrobium arenosum]